MTSRIHRALVSHKRYWSREHEFSYPVYVFTLDLDELPRLNKSTTLFGYNRFRLTSVHDRDFLKDGPEPIRDKLSKILDEHGLLPEAGMGKVILVTSARFLHYVFNPVSFYFVHGVDERLACVVAEVNNTFGEKHVYVLKDQLNPGEYPARFRTPKEFHVSPFFDLQGEYVFALSDIRQGLSVEICLYKGDILAFEARLEDAGTPVPITTGNLLLMAIRHPLRVSLTFPRILQEAAKLYFTKKLSVYTKPEPVSPMTIRR